MSGVLKRKLDKVDEDPCYSSSSPSSSSGWESDGESSSPETLDSRPHNPSAFPAHFSTTSILKRAKRIRRNNVQFDQVTVFFFPRCQGFTSVASRGGCTLGMGRQHSACRRYTLSEFAQEQQHLRREKLKDRLREEKLEVLKQELIKNGAAQSKEAAQLTLDDVSEDDIDVSGVDFEGGFFLHPYPSKRRHALLKAAGVKKIDKEEKRELHAIRLSREDCGCDCQGFCEPETCSCSLAGIKCQMDHSSFPCGCTKDGCGNTQGRIEFNSSRVQTHYIHTIMKLELEKRLEESTDTGEQCERRQWLEESTDTGEQCERRQWLEESTDTGEQCERRQWLEESTDTGEQCERRQWLEESTDTGEQCERRQWLEESTDTGEQCERRQWLEESTDTGEQCERRQWLEESTDTGEQCERRQWLEESTDTGEQCERRQWLEESTDTGEQCERRQQLSPFVFQSEEELRAVSASPNFHFSAKLDPIGENSCSSDMTDSSSSSSQSEYSSGLCAGSSNPQPDKPQSDVDDNGLARILSFNDCDNEDCSSSSSGDSCDCRRQVNFGCFNTLDFFNDNIVEDPQRNTNGGDSSSRHVCGHMSSISECLDENANQDTTMFHSSGSSQAFPSTPSPSIDHSSPSYMDLSLSSDSDFEFFHGFPDYSPGSLYNSLKEYENLDSFLQFQLPSFPQNGDPGTCFLESLIGVSEPVPEPPAAFTDNQLLEEAIKSSVMESVMV
ncbi:cysteine/serine-rich nuclear protein 1-like [Polyodon spathula]|uniref:cysteine/serine-rich nuclear protein 1-like n=1 Tax=Polyodon spathula TaxID=7913 RepID=UPI001B7E54B5|nr:cysteine/serine-rich nuclear protein 1-like [Polyodon spathula]XP_041102754.1 cysteine/serine-rich nuclear protein 1-like [Polyodon spathula]XP_041102755.1 cysteine/serine-rich nuclear protein 1-like [Polyodon spathula]